jgi:hypothetical protein
VPICLSTSVMRANLEQKGTRSLLIITEREHADDNSSNGFFLFFCQNNSKSILCWLSRGDQSIILKGSKCAHFIFTFFAERVIRFGSC